MLGPSGVDLANLIVANCGAGFDLAATGVWAAGEALYKSVGADKELLCWRAGIVDGSEPAGDGWVSLQARDVALEVWLGTAQSETAIAVAVGASK